MERHGPIEAWITRHYCGQLGKQDNYQAAESPSVAKTKTTSQNRVCHQHCVRMVGNALGLVALQSYMRVSVTVPLQPPLPIKSPTPRPP
jgi:hypothetical protein